MDAADLRAIRKRLGLTQGGFAAELGLSLRAYQDLEGGATPVRRLHELAVSAVALGQGLDGKRDAGPSSDPDQTLMGEFLVEITRLQGRLISAMKDGARLSGLASASESMILHAVATAATPPTAPRIARSLGYSRQAIHAVLERLERQGLIATAPNPQHRTARLLIATPKGSTVMRQTQVDNQGWTIRMTATVPRAEFALAVGVLKRLRRALETRPADGVV